MFLAAWFAVNLPLVLSSPLISDDQPDTPSGPDGGPALPEHTAKGEPVKNDPLDRFFEAIPRALGRDLIALSSDMHYLHVYTTQGKCMGGNSCKGHSFCHTATSACAGMNSCKGQGWIKATQAECEEKGGQYEG